MTDKPTVFEVLDRMREHAEGPGLTPAVVRDWADRIELAWRREREAKITADMNLEWSKRVGQQMLR